MVTGGPSAALQILMWVLAANAMLILSAFALVAWLRHSTQKTLRGLGEQIQEFANRLDRTAAFLQAYAGIDQEPFSTPLDALQKEASQIEAEVQGFLDTCRAFEGEMQAVNPNQLQGIINAPAAWLRRWQRAGALRKESDTIAGHLSAAEARMQSITNIPWELAEQCRQAEKEYTELAQTVRALQAQGARGADLQAGLSQLPVLQQALDEIPRVYLQSGQAELVESSSLDATIHAFAGLSRMRPVLARYLPEAREWDLHFQKATADFQELKQAGANLRQAVAHPPEGLVITSLQARLDQIAQLAADLGQRLGQPEVEQLKSLSREVGQLRKVIQATEQQLTRAGQQVAELHQSIRAFSENLDKLSSQFSALERSEIYPLVWDESGPVLNNLRQRLQDLGPTGDARPPEQVTQHLKEMEALWNVYRTLADKTPRTAEQHRALTALLESSEIKVGAMWIRKTREILAQTGAYDPRNWPKQDSIQTLPADLEELAKLQDRLAPPDPSTPIKESELARRLQDTQQFYAQHKAIRPRMESVQARLDTIKCLENEGKEKLTAAWTALDRVALLGESNELIQSIAAGEIERFSEEIRQLGNELNAQNQGEIEKKVQKIQVEAEKVNRALQQWLAQLNAAIAKHGQQINERLIQLDTIAGMEDAPIQEARGLLAKEEYLSALSATVHIPTGKTGPLSSSPIPGDPVPNSPQSAVGRIAARVAAVERAAAARFTPTEAKPALSELAATAEIKRKNDFWQTLLGVHTALEEKSAPLLSAFQETVQSRAESHAVLAEVTGRIPENKRVWPPSNQPPLSEGQLLGPIDEKMEALKKQRGRSESVLVELNRLAKQYQMAGERARQMLDRIDQDLERIQELEWQIGDLKQRWQTQVQADPTNPVIREGIQQIISQADSKLAFIKQQYVRGTISYEQVIRSLQLLYDELFSARVTVDDQNDLGLNEDIHPGGAD